MGWLFGRDPASLRDGWLPQPAIARAGAASSLQQLREDLALWV